MKKKDSSVIAHRSSLSNPLPDSELSASIERFLKYLQVERNSSLYTTKSYREDLTELVRYLSTPDPAQPDVQQPPPPPDCITTLDLRGYLSHLHELSLANSTISRRLASLRSFFRFGQREGWPNGNPAKPLRNPARPAHCRTF